MNSQPDIAHLQRTPLYKAHITAGGKIVPFAGYEMPVQYPSGVLQEHLWTREKAGLFDVSHMGQAFLVGPDHETTARALEVLVPADIVNIKPGQQRYTQLLNDEGGILDDLMVTRTNEEYENGVLVLVVNASRKNDDYAYINSRLPDNVKLLRAEHRALIALQGPASAQVLSKYIPACTNMNFMFAQTFTFDGMALNISRSGYTGEDGFEISAYAEKIEHLWTTLARDPLVKPVGLGARDSLRLEAGLCLYGHDIDETTSPIEAALNWSIQKRRREEGGFPGAARLQKELAEGPQRLRVGILPEGRAPAREGTEIVDPLNGMAIGKITSGGFGPSLNAPVAMGYVAKDYSAEGTPLHLMVRGKALPAKIAPLPFAPHRYHRPAKAA